MMLLAFLLYMGDVVGYMHPKSILPAHAYHSALHGIRGALMIFLVLLSRAQ